MIWHFAFFDIALIAYSMPFNIEWSYNNIFFQGHPFILYSHHQCYTMSPFCLIFTIAILALWSTQSQTYCNCLSICSLDSVQYLLFKFFDIVNMHSSFIVVILAVCNGDRLLPVRLWVRTPWKASVAFLEQDNLPWLFSTGWFQGRIIVRLTWSE